MKVFLYILMAWIMMGCGRHSVDPRLAQVNELANRNETDSAMMVLSGIEKQSLNEYNSRYYDLMSIKTRDKAYQDVTGDTVITDIIDYFDSNGNDYVKGEAYYYGGRVYREMGDAPQALDYFQKALDVFPEDEAMMKGKTASQMGQIFLNMYMFEHAKPKFQEAIRYQKDCNNYRGLMLDIGALADTYESMHQNDSALYYYYEVLDISKQIDPLGRYELETRASIVNLHISLKDLKSAQKEYAVIEPFIKQGNVSEYLLMTSINYNIISKQYDNVLEIASKLTESGELHNRKYAYDVLSELYLSRGKNDISYKYLQKSKQCEDSINSLASIDAVIYQNSFYNYSLREKENLLLKNEKLQSWVVFLTIILVFIIMIIIFINRYKLYKNKSDRLVQVNKSLLYEKDELLSTQEKLNLELIQHLGKISKLEDNIFSLEKDLSSRQISEKIKQQISTRIENLNTDTHIINTTVFNSEIYMRFRELLNNSKEKPTYKDWENLDQMVNEIYRGFKEKLYYLNKDIKLSEYKVCLLIKCEFSVTEISELTYLSKSAVTNLRTRLYRKLFGVSGTASEMDSFISSL